MHLQVNAVEHHVGTMAAEVSALAVQLNGQDVATVLQIRAAAELLAAGPAPAPTVAASAASVPGVADTNSGVAAADSATAARLPTAAEPGVSSVRARSKRNSGARPQLTIQLPGGSGSGSGGSEADAEQSRPQERPVSQLAMPFADDAAGLARARARAGVCTGGGDPVMSPAVVITAAVGGARVLLPHGCELGTAIRGTELWAKAFSQVTFEEQADWLPQHL